MSLYGLTFNMIEKVKDTFLYFAYGSNLLKRRIHINNPSAQFVGIGRLDSYELNFIKYSNNWRGASATIVPKEDSHIWGAIWRLHNNDMASLDIQEGVGTNWYFPKSVEIVTEDGSKVPCRTYQQTINPPPSEKGEKLPPERQPSSTYMDCIIKGASECNLPQYYVDNLKKTPDNGQKASPKMLEQLYL